MNKVKFIITLAAVGLISLPAGMVFAREEMPQVRGADAQEALKDILTMPEDSPVDFGTSLPEETMGQEETAGKEEAAGKEKTTGPIEVNNKICPVSGEKVGQMGEPIKVEHEGKMYNLCCPMCVKDFNKDPAKYVKIVEEELGKESENTK